MASDIFDQINNAVLDLQAANYSSYSRPIKTLARLLQNDSLKEPNETLIEGLNLEKFLEKQEKHGGIGENIIEWPEDTKEVLGLTYLLVKKFSDDPSYMATFGHIYYDSSSKIMNSVHAVTRQVIIPFIRDYKSYITSSGFSSPRLTPAGSNKVFIVHGHDEGALQGLARFLEKINLEAIVLSEKPNQGRTIIEKYEDYADEVGFAVVLLTPDDLTVGNGSDANNRRARQNVIFELGYFSGRLGRGRVCLLKKGDVEIPSDLFGVVYTEMDTGDGWKMSLIKELNAAQLKFDASKAWS